MTVTASYPKVCPICGAALTVIASTDPTTAPWGCYGCGRGYFVADLLVVQERPDEWDAAAGGWLSGTVAVAVQAASEQEVAAAQDRGTSLRVEQIEHVDLSTLALLLRRRGVSDDMKRAIRTRHPKSGEGR